MVRLYLPPRFSKRRMDEKVAEKALQNFGGPALFRHSKVIHSTACYLNKHGQLCTINVQAGAPYCPSDFWVLQFLRTYADCIVTTGKILRKEPDAFDTSMIRSMGFNPSIYFEHKDRHQKNVAILTNSLSENLLTAGNQIYKNRSYRKHLLSKDTIVDRFLQKWPQMATEFDKAGNMTLSGIEGLNLRKAIDHLANEYEYEMILLEPGASTTVPCYSQTHDLQKRKAPPIDFVCDGNPIDTLYLSIFQGQLPEQPEISEAQETGQTGFIGQPFVHMDWLMSQYNLVHACEPDGAVYNFEGSCSRTFWRKKSAKELAKLKEKSLGLRLVEHESEKWRKWQQQGDYERGRAQEKTEAQEKKGKEYASRSTDFERKKYPWLGDRRFQTRKPKQ